MCHVKVACLLARALLTCAAVKDPYQVLGVERAASQEQIRDSYRKLAKKLHPDLNPGSKAAESGFKDLSLAYEIVGDPDKRAKFDRGEIGPDGQPRAGAGPGAPGGEGAGRRRHPFYSETQRDGGRYSFGSEGFDEDFLSSIFGKRGASSAGGEDREYKMSVDFKDAVLGAEREIELPGGKKLRVKIPPGTDSGTRLRFRGQGGPGEGGAPAGDAYVEIAVPPSPVFRRSGDDLERELPLSLSEAVLGGEVRVPTLDGAVLLKIPPGVSSGARLRIRGKGVPDRSGGRGDLYAVTRIVLPKEVDSGLADAIRDWSRAHPYDVRGGMSE
jgi:DnaJ-class molecular chaperone